MTHFESETLSLHKSRKNRNFSIQERRDTRFHFCLSCYSSDGLSSACLSYKLCYAMTDSKCSTLPGIQIHLHFLQFFPLTSSLDLNFSVPLLFFSFPVSASLVCIYRNNDDNNCSLMVWLVENDLQCNTTNVF